MDATTERYFNSYATYRAAFVEVLGYARQSVAIFDPDLCHCGLENRPGISLLETLCTQSPQRNAVRILLHSTAFIERECPRLLRILALHGHRASVRTTDPGARAWSQPFLIADQQYVVTRLHQDLPRGKICTQASSMTAHLDSQFETMWLNGECATTITPLGI